MSTPKIQNRYRIPRARYEHHDYNGGFYFVTNCQKKEKKNQLYVNNVKFFAP
jgi:hypothetical protein